MNDDERDVQRLFKTLARMARCYGDGPRGRAAGVERALRLLPFFPEYYTRTHQVRCTRRHLLNLANITAMKLERYRTGHGLSEERSHFRQLAIQIMDRGVVLTEDDAHDLCCERV